MLLVIEIPLEVLVVVVLSLIIVRLYFYKVARFFWPLKRNRTEHVSSVASETLGRQLGAVKQRYNSEHTRSKDLHLYKELYYQVQNLENYQDVLPKARSTLLALFSEAIDHAAEARPVGSSVVDVAYDSLENFLEQRDEWTSEAWKVYLKSRMEGAPRDLFQTRQEALAWLRWKAPAKFVDGAWLGHIHTITTPFALRPITKDAWQVFSEELGNGDRSKNHVYVYQELLDGAGAPLPRGDTVEFTHPENDLNDAWAWKGGVAQLLISLFPHDYLPEILGFNLHFELLALDTLKASKELAEIGINPYYFVLHVTIDNAHSGHTAMALQVVTKYLDHIRETDGEAAVQRAWKRVQAGFILSDYICGDPPRKPRESGLCPLEAGVLEIFKGKTLVAHRVHCSSRIKVGQRKLVEWLDPRAFSDEAWQREFMVALSNARPWVRRGNSADSKLIQELAWGGKMFGSFTHSETARVARWIDSLAAPPKTSYWTFTGQTPPVTQPDPTLTDIRSDYPVFPFPTPHDVLDAPDHPPVAPTTLADRRFPPPPALLALWLASPCLLERVVSVPAAATTPTASAVLRLLRAQHGFLPEHDGVDGMDEARRAAPHVLGLVDVGLRLATAREGAAPPPASLRDALERWGPCDGALRMLRAGMRPRAYLHALLGASAGFAELHEALAATDAWWPAGDVAARDALARIAVRERDALAVCMQEIGDDRQAWRAFKGGRNWARREIGHAVEEEK
jgi:Iron-containing redox enzyme